MCFFKQDTAYEMRIGDWSSDVCSSDRIHGAQLTPRVVAAIRRQLPQQTPTAAQIARTLELNERSLRRRLQSAQISFGDLLARVRRELTSQQRRVGKERVSQCRSRW